MNGLAQRLQRRAEGRGPDPLPLLTARSVDLRFGLTSPLADTLATDVEDPFAAAAIAEPAPSLRAPSMATASPTPATRTAPAVGPAPVTMSAAAMPWPRVERSAEPSTSPIIEPSRPASTHHVHTAPVRQDSRDPAQPVRVSSTVTEVVTIREVAPLAPAPERQLQAERSVPEPGTRRLSRDIPTTSSDPTPATEPRPSPTTSVQPAPRPAPMPAQTISAPTGRPPARLEPRPRAPGPSHELADPPPAPRVVIGNLHIEVVRAPAAPAPRREPTRREKPRSAASPNTTSTRARRRTVFGLGQL